MDGECNSLRTKENSRPLSVFQICADVRSKYSRIRATILHVLGKNGAVAALLTDPAVSPELLGELSEWISEGASLNDAIERLRL